MTQIRINKNESAPSRRRLYFQCFDVADGITPETGEAGGQPQVSVDGSTWTNTGIGVLTSIGNGRYYSEVTQALTNVENSIILTRYKSANTTETIGDTGIIDSSLIDLIWDEVLTGSTHNVTSSAGRRLRQLAGNVITDGIAVGAGINGNQIILDSAASSISGSYDPSVIGIVSGTGLGQCRLILDYDGATKTATVDRTWRVLPDSTSEYIIYADAGREHVNEGLAIAGTSNTIILNSDASPLDSNYVNQLVFIRSGHGEDQVGLIKAYNGSTKVATIDKNWGIIPNSTSAYVILPTHVHDLDETSSSVWSNSTRTLTSSGSGGATASEVWNYSTRTITGASGLASSIWEYENRTLTNWRQIVIDIWNSVPSWLSKRLEQYVESDYSLYRGVTNEISIISNVNLRGASNIVFSIKNNASDPDSKSLLRIESLNGLVIMNGSQYPDSINGEIVVFDEYTGSIKIILSSIVSNEIVPSQKRLYDIKVKIGDEVKLVSRGKIDLLPDITNVI